MLVLLHTVHEFAEWSTLVQMDLHRFAFLVMIHEHATVLIDGRLVLVWVNVVGVETPQVTALPTTFTPSYSSIVVAIVV